MMIYDDDDQGGPSGDTNFEWHLRATQCSCQKNQDVNEFETYMFWKQKLVCVASLWYFKLKSCTAWVSSSHHVFFSTPPGFFLLYQNVDKSQC